MNGGKGASGAPDGGRQNQGPGAIPLTRKERLSRAWEIFVVMLRTGLFTFGGGWSIVSELELQFIAKRGWMTKEDLLDYISIGKSIPGVMVVNLGVLLGYRFGGPLCAAAAAFGLTLPALAVIAAVALFYENIRTNPYIAKALSGVRAAVIAIIFNAARKLWKPAVADGWCFLLFAAALFFCVFTDLNLLVLVLTGAAAGLILKGVKPNDPR